MADRNEKIRGVTIEDVNCSQTTNSNILVASDSISDATLIKKLLDADFDKIFTTTDSDRAVADFDRYRPNVLILAFNAFEKSKSYYLGLFRRGGAVHLHPHRTVVLCGKEKVQQAYKLCCEGIFDDYILFWPMTMDAFRLPMSVRLALRELTTARNNNSPTAEEFAAQARRLITLEGMLAKQMAQGDAQINSLDHAIAKADKNASTALNVFSQRLIRHEMPEAAEVKSIDKFQQEMKRLKREAIQAPVRDLTGSVQPLKQWSSEFRDASSPYLESVRTLNVLAESVQPTLLVVDDDEFQHTIIDSALSDENYHLLFATTGIEALNILRKTHPALILMDIKMPGMNGVEVVQQIRAAPRFDAVPILMITGKSEKATIIKSQQAGANGFIVKPFTSSTLLDKIKQTLIVPS